MNLVDTRKKCDQFLAEFRNARWRCRTEQEALDTIREKTENTKQAQAIIQEAAAFIQQQVHRQIADVVTRCLEAVFDEPYSFNIRFESKRGRTEASLILERDGVEVDPMTAAGGGVVDVVAFALRLACLSLSHPPVRPLLVLDEPFKFVSAQYLPRVRLLLETLSKDMGVQILMVTHLEALRTGTVVELGG